MSSTSLFSRLWFGALSGGLLSVSLLVGCRQGGEWKAAPARPSWGASPPQGSAVTPVLVDAERGEMADDNPGADKHAINQREHRHERRKDRPSERRNKKSRDRDDRGGKNRGGAGKTPAAGAALAGLSEDERELFKDGRDEFVSVQSEDDGLGPVFNGKSCVECHSDPVVGGSSQRSVTRFGRTTGGVFDPMTREGGPVLQDFAVPGTRKEKIPTSANTVTRRRTTTLLGLGLVEAIPDAAIVANAAKERAANPDMAGAVVMVSSAKDGKQRVGRFGWKCQHALLIDFSADAFLNEIGASSSFFPFQNAPNGPQTRVKTADLDDTPDPESGLRESEYFAAFIRFLAPHPNPVVEQNSMTFAQGAPLARGARLFESVGCAACHTPSFTTASPIAALNNKTVWGFSDWLVHDIGTGDGIVQGNAPASKVRTAPLIDVAHVPAFLHDSSAATVRDAVLRHAGEASSVTAGFKQLPSSDQEALLAFVKAL